MAVLQTYTLAEVRNGTGWPEDARFALVTNGLDALLAAANAAYDALTDERADEAYRAEAARLLRDALANAPKPNARIAWVTEGSQYGATVFHPDCDVTREMTRLRGKKTVTWNIVELLKAAGYEVRVRGARERAL
jgi:hypothetical protein